jgi:hypothetical protein
MMRPRAAGLAGVSPATSSKKRSHSVEKGVVGMPLLGWIIGGIIGGAIGAGIWAGVAYGTGYESGWIAVAIGALAGTGVRMGSSLTGGQAAGLVAAVLAGLSILGGKYFALQLVAGEALSPQMFATASIANVISAERGSVMPPNLEEAQTLADFYPPDVWAEAERRYSALSAQEQEVLKECPSFANPDYVLAVIAEELCKERAAAGQPVNWPMGMSADMAWLKADFPSDIWAESVVRWEAMTPTAQEAYREQVRNALRYEDAQMRSELDAMVASEGYFATFSMYDLLWFGLALAAAFRIGSGPSE